MQEREPIIVGGLVTILLLLWLGFPLHQSPRFAGSFWGGVLGISGASLMLVPLVYLIIKRIKPLKQAVTRRVSMRTLLAWHIYAGVLGPILVVIHTGHKFESPLGIALTALTLLVVLSGYVGRYLMSRISREIREKQAMLADLRHAYDTTMEQLRTCCAHHAERIRPYAGFFPRLLGGFFVTAPHPGNTANSASIRAIHLADSIADVEYAIRTHETFKKAFGRWLKFHIAISLLLYGLLALHIYGAVYFGLRWSE